MSARRQRGYALLEARRPDAALVEFMAALGEDPRDADAHLGAAACHLATERWEAAADAARQAVALVPDRPEPYAVLAEVELHRKKWDEATSHAMETLRLAPWDASNHGRLGRVMAGRNRWPEALAAADAGLAEDPEDEECANLRSLALLHTGERDAAAVAAEETLKFAPDSSVTHTTRGFTALHEGRHAKAREHFQEALRLDPTNDAAREGLVIPIKATWPLYRWWVAWALWYARLGNRAQWAVILGGFILVRVLRAAAKANPALDPWVTPIVVAYIAFVLVTWLADPIGNVILRLHPVGRHALSREKRIEATIVAVLLFAALGLGGWSVAGAPDVVLPAAVVCAGLLFPVVAFFALERGSGARIAAGVWTGLLAFVGLLGIALLAAAPAEGESLLAGAAGLLLLVFVIGAVATTWLSTVFTLFSRRRR